MYRAKISQDNADNKKWVMALITEAVNDKALRQKVGKAIIHVRGSKGNFNPPVNGVRSEPTVLANPEETNELKHYSRMRFFDRLDMVMNQVARSSNLGLDYIKIEFLNKSGDVLTTIELS